MRDPAYNQVCTIEGGLITPVETRAKGKHHASVRTGCGAFGLSRNSHLLTLLQTPSWTAYS